MDGVLVPPAAERQPDEQAECGPEHVVRAARSENEPCVQSWKTMNVRIRNPAAGTASAERQQTETCSANTITTSRTRYGTTDVPRSTGSGRDAAPHRERAPPPRARRIRVARGNGRNHWKRCSGTSGSLCGRGRAGACPDTPVQITCRRASLGRSCDGQAPHFSGGRRGHTSYPWNRCPTRPSCHRVLSSHIYGDGPPTPWRETPCQPPSRWAAARPAARPENRQPPRNVPSSAL